MDNITHGIVGGWIMDAVLGRSYDDTNTSWWKRNKIMIVGGLIANIPDIDIFIGKAISWNNPIDAFMFHRSYTHTFLFAALISLLVGRWGAKKDSEKRPVWRRMLASFLTIGVGHLFVDAMTSYGIRWFLPFSDMTYSFNNVFVVDLIYTIPLIALWLIYIFLKRPAQRRVVKIISRVWLIIYPLMTFVMKHHVDDVLTRSLKADHISYSRMLTSPEPLQGFLRRGVVQSGPGYYEAYYSLFDATPATGIVWRYIGNNTIVRKALLDKPDVQKVENFAQGWTSYSAVSGQIFIDVVKMGPILGRERGEKSSGAQFAFRIGSNGMVLGQTGMGRFLGASFSEVWNKHWERVWGNK